MYTLIWILGVVILGGAIIAYWRSHDAMHPAVVLSPLFAYSCVLSPLILNSDNGLEKFFKAEQLDYVALVILAAVTSLWVGLLHNARLKRTSPVPRFQITLKQRDRIFKLSLVLGVMAIVAYVWMTWNAGGLLHAYSHSKGGGRSSSGYVIEAVLLAFPAVILLALSRKGQRVRKIDIALAVAFMSPHLFQGILGGRRGPIFVEPRCFVFCLASGQGSTSGTDKDRSWGRLDWLCRNHGLVAASICVHWI